MYQIDNATAVATRPTATAAGTAGWFTDGSPGGGVAATILPAEFMNMLMAELMSVLSAGGVTLDKTNSAQLAIAIQSGNLVSASATGTADAITSAFTPIITTLKDGMSLYVRAAFTNATTTPTFSPNSGVITAKTIVKGNGLPLVAGDIAGAGHWIELQYDSVLDKWVLLNPANGVKALGSGQTWQDVVGSRAVNTIYTNTTGRPIYFVGGGTSTVAVGFYSIVVNGVTVGSSNIPINTAFSMGAVVPPGATYALNKGGGDTLTSPTWTELR